jgi:hypothetical protein
MSKMLERFIRWKISWCLIGSCNYNNYSIYWWQRSAQYLIVYTRTRAVMRKFICVYICLLIGREMAKWQNALVVSRANYIPLCYTVVYYYNQYFNSGWLLVKKRTSSNKLKIVKFLSIECCEFIVTKTGSLNCSGRTTIPPWPTAALGHTCQGAVSQQPA